MNLKLHFKVSVVLIATALAAAVGGFSQASRSGTTVEVPPRVAVQESATAWSFGVMADTQWIGDDDGKNPNSVAVSVVNRLNQEFIKRGVKLVVQVGDLSDRGTPLGMDTRATYAQALYNAGIAFYPLRGNHDARQATGAEFVRVFPQTRDGGNNATPADAFVTTPDDVETMPMAKTGTVFAVGANFSSPSENLNGLSYCFDYRNVRFVLLDQFTALDGAANSIDRQQGWISRALSQRAEGTHAFVFGHKALIDESHVDTIFGSNPAQNPEAQDAFISSLSQNGVRYFLGGHDHMHNRSVYTTTDGASSVIDIICASDSSKFYIPKNPSNDDRYNVPAFGRNRQMQLAQELNTIGYYICTVDGPSVTFDYYSAPVNPTLIGGEYGISTLPPLTFTRRDSFGYSLGGKEFPVPAGKEYEHVIDGSFSGTSARILGRSRSDSVKDGSGRAFSRLVATGWTAKTTGLYSDILSLWDAAGFPAGDHDTFVISMSYDANAISDELAKTGRIGLAVKAGGFWSNAAGNTGSDEKFVIGPYEPGCRLGSYGVDLGAHTFWAVVNFSGDFAIAPGI